MMHARIQNMSYLSYLNRCQKWMDRGQVGNILEDQSDDASSQSSGDEKEKDANKQQN